MRNIVYKIADEVGYAELQGGVTLQVISHEPGKKVDGKAYEVSKEELDRIKKSKRKTMVVDNITKDKEPLSTTP